MYRSTALRALLVAPLAVSATIAGAQETSDAASAGDAKASDTTVNAGVDIAAGYNDNVYATRNREQDDYYFLTRPFLRAELGSGATSATFRGQGEIGRYADLKSENYDDWMLSADGRARIAKDISVLGGAEWRWDHENRASPEAVSGLYPTQYQRGFGYLALVGRRGRFTGRLAGTITRHDFSDVATANGTINNDDRDRLQAEIGARAGLDLKSGTQLFVQGGYDQRDYDVVVDDYGYRRNSDGYSLAAGLRGKIDRQFTGEFFAGWLLRDYIDPRLKDISTFDVGAVLDWTGKGGLGGSFRLDRSAEETTLPGASGYIVTSGRIGLRSEANPRLSAGVGLTGSHYQYVGEPRTEFVIGGDVWAKYWLGRNIFVGANYRHDERSSNAAGYDYERNRFEISIGAQLRPGYDEDASPLQFGAEVPGGAYVGFLLGHGTLVTALDGPRGEFGTNTADFGNDGPAAVAVAGFGVLVQSLYLGLEAEASVHGPEWIHSSDRTFSVTRNNAAGLSARVGVATERNDLVYARFGWSTTEFRTNYDHGPNSYSAADRRTGFGGGFGIEAPAGPQGFFRAEYVVTSFDDIDVPTGGGNFDNFSSMESQFRFGGGVRFGKPTRERDELGPIDFSGAYAGLQIGHGALTTSNQGPRNSGSALEVTRSSHGGLAGIFAGYGEIIGRSYLGLEAELEATAIDWNIERDPNGRIYSAQPEWSYGGSVRAGMLLGNSALLYGRIGGVRTRFDVPYATSGTSVRSIEWRSGLRYGVGLEIGLGERTRLRADYSKTNYKSYDVEYGHSADRFDHAETAFRLGVSWRL